MSALADVLRGRGLEVTGSDRQESPVLKMLREKGITVYAGEDARHIEGAGAVIRTAAAHEDNPEVEAARKAGIPVLERADAWGVLTKEYARALCIAGTHGKTTTTGMAAHIAVAAGTDPTIMVGGSLPLLGGTYRVGNGDLIVLESCEYCNSYHRFFPTTAVVLNIEEDHLDFFSDLDEIIASFRKFASLVPSGGHIVGNADDENVRTALTGMDKITWFGLGANADVTAANVIQEHGRHSFDLVAGGQCLCRVELRVPGRHNMLNALAAAAAALAQGMPVRAVREGLGAFNGAGRRMEFVGTANGADIYDDYAHHPTEIRAALSAARAMGHSRVVCLFQPHTYSRTKLLYNDFVRELRAADLLFLSDIYAARERDPGDISAAMLAADIPGAVYCPGFENMARAARVAIKPGDIVITMGAGDICNVGRMIINEQPRSVF